ncbi:hypothetical protein ACFPRL_11370 [Pseudoclavibacter helvolus]
MQSASSSSGVSRRTSWRSSNGRHSSRRQQHLEVVPYLQGPEPVAQGDRA